MLNFEVPDLYVKDYNNVFPGKQEALLNALKSAEKDHGKDAPVKLNKPKPSPKIRRVSTKAYRNKESIFKVPEVPFKVGNVRRIMSKSSVRRGNWIKYDLSDVEEMSESSNAEAAFSFLNELQNRKRKPEDTKPIDPENFKPVFKKPEQIPDEERKTTSQSAKSSTTISTILKPREKPALQNTSVIKLNHLLDDESD